jgi:hypothetical protein
MMSVAAAALIAGTGFAYAQGTGTSREAPSSGSAVQQSAPSSGNSSPSTNRSGGETTSPSPGMKATDEKSPGAVKNQRAEDKDGMQGQKSKSMGSDNAKGGKDMKAEGREGRSGDKDMKAEGRNDRNGNMNAEQKGSADSRSQTTTGQAGAGVKLSGEQRTKITSVIREQHVQPVTNVNFSISPGVRVPRTVSFHSLPQEIVTIYPEWRGYEYFLVNDKIVVVNPRTLEIVDVLDA